jgi:ankyrin repeat protein
MQTYLGRFSHSPIPLLSVTLAMLSWGSLAFCGQIHYAAKGGDLNKIKILLKVDPALVSSKDKDHYDYTPLHYAAKEGHREVVQLLLAAKAEVNAKDRDGATPLHLALQMDHQDVAELLGKHGGKDYRVAAEKGREDANKAPTEGTRSIALSGSAVKSADGETPEQKDVAPAIQPSTDYPFAKKVPDKSGHVFSPYNNKIVDVRDIPSGTLVQDPTYPSSSKKFFRVP